MNFDRLNPWNWFKHEEQQGSGARAAMPVRKDVAKVGAFQHPMARMYQEMDRLFDQMFDAFDGQAGGSSLASTGVLTQPKIDISGDKQRYQVTLDVPGFKEDDLAIDVSGDVLTISGRVEERSEKNEKHYYRVERRLGSFKRTLALPSDAVGSEIHASLKNGVLDLEIPRRELPNSKRKTIAIESP